MLSLQNGRIVNQDWATGHDLRQSREANCFSYGPMVLTLIRGDQASVPTIIKTLGPN